MKIRSLILGLCVSLCSSVFAANQDVHPQASSSHMKSTEKTITYPGYCDIEIINSSFENVTVYGTFDDGINMEPFNVYSFGGARYIPLYYYGYCHAGMNLYIESFSGYPVYSGFAQTGGTIRILPYFANQLKAEVTKN